MFGRRVNICADAGDWRVILMYARHTKIGDLDGFAILRQQKVLRLDITMNDSMPVSMPKAGTYLFKIFQDDAKREVSFPRSALQITSCQVF
jgi:hypothetical protein